MLDIKIVIFIYLVSIIIGSKAVNKNNDDLFHFLDTDVITRHVSGDNCNCMIYYLFFR